MYSRGGEVNQARTGQASPLLEDEEVDGEDVQDRKSSRKRSRRGGGSFGRREGDAALCHGLENLLANPERLCVALAVGRDNTIQGGWNKRGSEGGRVKYNSDSRTQQEDVIGRAVFLWQGAVSYTHLTLPTKA